MEKILKYILTALAVILPMLLCAEEATDCRRLFDEGLAVKRTMSIPAQRRAIDLLQRAADCYDSETDKAACARHISLCNEVIKRLGGVPIEVSAAVAAASDTAAVAEAAAADSTAAEAEPETAPAVSATVVETLAFEALGAEAVSRRVSVGTTPAIYGPVWVEVSVEGDIVTIAPTDNPGPAREGVVAITSPAASFAVKVTQSASE